ncbi:insulinase family protein [Roseovarius salis]|uniref:M16 family metallopeptidase n=1 Tax=Roseovarius salis TaxID=3376063 RepID=UPI0037C605EE
MRKLVALLAVVLVGAVPARAKDAVTTMTLDNGMEVVVIEDHRAPAAVHMVWYRAGSADEPPGVSGVAHFLEHLMFKGTDTLEPGEFSATVARNGGRDNAFTSYDYTAYFQRVAADRLELMMRMESDRMVNLRLREADIATERDVIIEERNQRVENNPAGLFRERLNATQYLNHPYGTPIIGWQQEMSALDMQDALGYYETYYAPNNAILVVAGDVTPQEVSRLARKYYGKIPANPELPERGRPQEPRQLAERRIVLEDDRVGQPFVMRSYLAPERDSGAQATAAALTVLADVLGDGTTSVLNAKLQFEDKIAVYTAARYSGKALDDTTFEFVVVPAPGVTLEQAETALDEVLTGFLEDGIDPAHLDRVKMQLRAQEVYARDNVFRLANRYGRALTQGLTVEDVQAWPEVLQSVTEEDVMRVARQVFDREAAVTGWLKAPEVTQ